jgi:DNA-binding LacI/PurR family transcriptional regulator
MRSIEIENSIAQLIFEEKWCPEDRIPIREELMKKFSSSRATVQKAMENLQREGFIEALGKSGTFVSQKPPNLYTIGVVFPVNNPDSSDWDSLWSIIMTQKNELEELTGRQLRFYYLNKENPSCPEHTRLLDDVSNSRISGVFFPYPPSLDILNEITAYKAPVVALTIKETKNYPDGVACVWSDYKSFIDKSLDFFEEKGREKIAMLANTKLPFPYVSHFLTEAEKRGFKSDEAWTQGISLDSFSRPWTSRLVKLLIQEGPNGRPDGIIIANENLAAYALETLYKEKVQIGSDILITMQTNFPASHANTFGVKRIGFDIRKILKESIISLDDIKRNRKNGCTTFVKADTENDL